MMCQLTRARSRSSGSCWSVGGRYGRISRSMAATVVSIGAPKAIMTAGLARGDLSQEEVRQRYGSRHLEVLPLDPERAPLRLDSADEFDHVHGITHSHCLAAPF